MERLLDYFQPEHYDLSLTIDREQETIAGIVQISGNARAEMIKFHALGLKIKSVKIAVADEKAWRDADFEYDNQVVSISQIKADSALRVLIEFTTTLNRNMQGCYLSTYEHLGQTRKIATTQFESHYAREAFPCIDEPAAKATFSLTLDIPDLAEDDIVLSSMPVNAQNRHRFEFVKTPRMSTYLLAWVVGPLHGISATNQNGVKVSSYCALNQSLSSLKFANTTAMRALEYYDQKFHEKYPLPKLDQVAVPDFEAGAMENWGLVTYRESCLLADEHATLEARKSVAVTVTHELSHQWFGNLVTMAWWDDLWLNESFATIMEYLATDELYPEFKIWQDFYTGDCLAALRRDALRGVQSVQQAVHDPAEIATLFDGAIVYAKGARLILMLIRLMGEEKFTQGICQYFDQYKYQNTVGDDLWRTLQDHADFDIAEFMHTWLAQPGYPALQYAKNGKKVFWHQQRFFLDGTTDDTRWPLPEVKEDMSGHYLIEWSDTEFQTRLKKFDQYSPEEQLRLLIDRTLLAKAGIVPSASLLDLLPKFACEQSASVWKLVSNMISDLKLFFEPETQTAKSYKTYLGILFAKRLSAIDLDMADCDTNAIQVRDMLLSLAYYIEDENILSSLADRYTDDYTKLDPELRLYILAAKMFFDEANLFPKLLADYSKMPDPELKSDILYCLALARQSTHLDQLISLLNQPKMLRPQDHIFLYIYLLRNYRTREKALDWLIAHWDYVKQLTGEKSIEDYPRYTASVIRNDTEAQKYHDFFDQFRDDPILRRTLQVAQAEISAHLQLIHSESTPVQARINELVSENVSSSNTK